ncbi:type II toxin-antitoxin system HicB family antitoxin [Bradyrhizobium sp. HKCCYLR20261]|uniref:type II toxin-antitoxin system HicB family antitoxin n=1 Tax=Bradyrhizobium sp. HKCCYLR20261 TaxID=3420760 RepID=UPI003EBF5473
MSDVDAYVHDVTELGPDDGGGFLVTFPDLPGVIGIGETIEQAIVDGRQALFAGLDAFKAVDREPPAAGASRAAARPA